MRRHPESHVRLIFRKVYAHDFDSIGHWWVFHRDQPTGVGYPWGALHLEDFGEVTP